MADPAAALRDALADRDAARANFDGALDCKTKLPVRFELGKALTRRPDLHTFDGLKNIDNCVTNLARH